MKKRTALFIGGGITVCTGILLALMIGRSVNKTGRSAVEYEEIRNSSGGAGADLAGMARSIQKSEVATPEVLLMQHRLYFRYPPDSRPLTRNMTDLIDPWRVKPAKQALYAHKDHAPDEKPIAMYAWSCPSFMVTGSTPVACSLELTDPDTGVHLKPRILSADVLSDLIFGRTPIGRADSTESEAGSTTISWTPRAGERLHWGELEMKVIFDAGTAKNLEVSTVFNSTPTAPAVFTGDYSDRLDDGSLIISVSVDVRKAGKYVLDANLYDQAGEAYGRVHSVTYLEAGPQVVPLRFFGIIFHDRGFGSGRFVLQNLRGRRMNLPFDPRRLDAMLARGEMPPTNTEPLDEWIPPPGRDFVTKSSYNVEDFSTREYEGADKEAKLKQLEQYARDWGKNSG